jgi:hypothetical protein
MPKVPKVKKPTKKEDCNTRRAQSKEQGAGSIGTRSRGKNWSLKWVTA